MTRTATALKLVVVLSILGIPVAYAQPTATIYRLGILSGGPPASRPIEAFRQGLRELGWVEGQNIVIEPSSIAPAVMTKHA